MTKLPTPMSEKTEEMKEGIESFFPGTKQAIAEHKCPICKKPIQEMGFRDKLSIKEFGISGMCQECQDDIFGTHHPDLDNPLS